MFTRTFCGNRALAALGNKRAHARSFFLPLPVAACLALTACMQQPEAPPPAAAAKPSPPEPTPLAQWCFAQADGNFVPDASGHGYEAKIHGQPRLVARWGGQKALEFDGSGDNNFWSGGDQDCGLSIGKRLNRGFTNMTIEAWVRKSPAWWMAVLFRDKWDDPSGFGLYTEWQSGKAVFGHYDNSGHKSGVQSETTVQDEQWHYVTGTLQPAKGDSYVYRIYVDGKLDAEQVGVWAVEEAPAEGGILKIAYPNITGADQPYKGALDCIALFDIALTPEQIAARYNKGKPH